MGKKKEKKIRKSKVDKPFSNGTMSSSAFFGMIRSALRKRTMYWRPISDCKMRQRIPYKGPNKLRKWSYICEECKKEFDSKGVAVHHKIHAGELKTFSDLPGFVERLFVDTEGLLLLCHCCHDKKHSK